MALVDVEAARGPVLVTAEPVETILLVAVLLVAVQAAVLLVAVEPVEPVLLVAVETVLLEPVEVDLPNVEVALEIPATVEVPLPNAEVALQIPATLPVLELPNAEVGPRMH